jgi:predicted phosphoadenosine phosphosulfate sulfurtransferase
VWEKMIDRVPGVGAAVRYARTELYAYRDRPQKTSRHAVAGIPAALPIKIPAV